MFASEMRLLMGTILVLCCTQSAAAVPVAYHESIGGDLPDFGSPVPTFAFDIGVNSIAGRFATSSTAPGDFDSFAFTIPALTELVAANVSLADIEGNISGTTWEFRAGTANSHTGTLLELVSSNSPGSYTFTSPPLGPDVYNLGHTQIGASGGGQHSADYAFEFVVLPIPEPTSASLLAIGAAALLHSRRRDR
jgi:hypothetical protein